MTYLPNALCREVDPDLFSDDGDANRHQTAQAQSIYRACPDRLPCLEVALRGREYGVWGGTTTRDRDNIRASRRRAA